MRLVLIADTEGNHRGIEIPEGDVLVHAGDIIGYGNGMLAQTEEYKDFLAWLNELPHQHKIFIGGNHDHLLEGIKADELVVSDGTHYLHNSAIEIDGVKFWGSPNTVSFFGMPFEETEDALEEIYKEIPDDTDVLITHVPPYGILDKSSAGKNCGSTALHKRVFEVNPRIHVCGHIHHSYGSIDKEGTSFYNAAYMHRGNAPIVVDI